MKAIGENLAISDGRKWSRISRRSRTKKEKKEKVNFEKFL
jgi:hypothetical protein